MDELEQIANEISMLLPKIMRGMRAALPATTNVSAPQLILLLAISEKGICNATDLSKEIKVSAPTVTGFVDRLMRDKYLIRIPDKVDRRVVNIKLTPKGEQLVNKFLGHIKKRWVSILIHFTTKERQDYLKFLKKILVVLTEEEKPKQ